MPEGFSMSIRRCPDLLLLFLGIVNALCDFELRRGPWVLKG
jgi:hypothetical protein